MFSLRDKASSWDGSGASGFTWVRKYLSTSVRVIGEPSTIAHTPSPGGEKDSLLQPDAKARAAASMNQPCRRILTLSPLLSSDAERRRLGCFLDAAGPNAGSTNADVNAHAVNDRADALKIRIPAASPGVVRMANHVAKRRSLAADFAFLCHCNSSPILLRCERVKQFSRVQNPRHAN